MHQELQVVTAEKQEIDTERDFAALNGRGSVAGIDPATYPRLTLDCTEFNWKSGKSAKPGEVVSVRVILRQGEKTLINHSLVPLQYTKNGESFFSAPDPLNFFYRAGAGPVKFEATLKYLTPDGHFKDLVHQSNDLSVGGSLTLTMDDFLGVH